MFLQIGNLQRIDNPTPEQIEHHLRNLSSDAPFVILNADAEHFIQATSVANVLRVEWRQEAQQRFTIVPVERAVQAFVAFHRWDEPVLNSFGWKRLSTFNDPYHRVIIAAVIVVVLVLVRLWWNMR